MRLFLELISTAADQFPQFSEVRHTASLAYPQMLEMISEQPRDTVAVFGTYFADSARETFTPAAVAAETVIVTTMLGEQAFRQRAPDLTPFCRTSQPDLCYDSFTMEPNTGAERLPPGERQELLARLQERFEDNMNRHDGLVWTDVHARLDADPERLWSLGEMERTGGEPDAIARDEQTGEYVFCDCSPESPSGRRSLCYDREALDSRKENKPKDSVVDAAAAMGVELLTEEQYRELQQLGEFDVKTSSWVLTPSDVRNLGGALFCDRRYGRVFVYHNGAQSYYAARGFRGLLRV